MFSLYLFSAIVGGGLLVFSLSGHGDGHGHDFGGGHAAGHDVAHDHNPFKFLSLRTLTYFLFVFGGVGAVLTKMWSSGGLLVLLLSVVSGLGVGAMASFAFQYLRNTDSGQRDSDESFVGLTGRMSVPMSAGGAGKVLVRRGDRSFELLAQPLDATTAPSTWKAVVVVEMKKGTAIVSPVDEATLQ
jgi:membrane protein implicated in regulation of membrane protease activity